LVHQLLYAALIEARSCERFRLLSESIADQALQKFYRKLMISEAHHYSLFLKLARQYGKNEKTVNEKWEALLEYESQLMTQLGKKETIHG
jgi:tRNA-(ms[2]io[6]A)-hydroxylase